MRGNGRWSPTKWRWRHYKDGRLVWASGLDIPEEPLSALGVEHGSKFDSMIRELQEFAGNVVTDEGEGWFLNAALRNVDVPTSFELILSTSNTLAETSAYANRSELGDGNGYAAKSVARSTGGWTAPTGTTPTSTTTPTAGTHDWTATGAWSIVYNGCIITVGATADRLIAYNGLAGGAGRTLATDDTLSVDFDLNAGGS